MEPSTKRIRNVETFVKEVDESVECQVVLISDMYGPTKFDPNLNMLVVSTETFKGGLKVNELRKSNHLSELDMHVVDLVEEFETSAIEEKKISSSTGRMRLLGAHLKNPKVS